jgi:hypothetical protein
MKVLIQVDLAKQFREMYPEGTRLRMIHMTDPYPVPTGTEGTVNFVDDAAQVHVAWDNGSNLAVHPLEDEFEVIQARSH